MYFKILKPEADKYSEMGMINISAQLFLEEGDEGFDKYHQEHFVTTKNIPDEGYLGEVDKMGMPVDEEDYNKWFDSLPNIQRYNPFCTHSIQFEPDVTEEEILWCFEWALGITHQNYIKDDLRCQKGRIDGNGYFLKTVNYEEGGQIVNQDIKYNARKSYYTALKFLPKSLMKQTEKNDFEKVSESKVKVSVLESIDLAKVKTVAKYRVK